MNGAPNDAGYIDSGEFLPLRGLGVVLIVLLAGSVALAAATLALPYAHLHVQAWQMHNAVSSALVVSSRVTGAATIIVFLIWFHRARINAERLGWRQRRARAWTFWGWIIPIADLWIPFQLMGDIWRAGLPPAERSRTAWLPALWWVSWLLAAPPVHVRSGKTSAAWIIPPDGWLSFALYAIAGLTLIEIVRRVSTGPVGWPDVGPDDPMAGGGPHLAATSI